MKMRKRNLREINKYIQENILNQILDNPTIIFNSLEVDDTEWYDFWVEVNGMEKVIFFKHLKNNLFWIDYSENEKGLLVNVSNDFLELITE
jgi:hypothetical protein